MSKFFILVPARINSDRLKNKMIKPFSDGSTVIGRTINQCIMTNIETFLITDSKEISQKVNLSTNNIFIEEKGNSGTERISYALNKSFQHINDSDYCIIVLGDQPEVNPKLISRAKTEIESLSEEIDGVTFHFKNNCIEDFLGTKNCKMILGKNNITYYISRSPIPGFKEIKKYKNFKNFNQHISIVCLKAEWVRSYIDLSSYEAITENNEWLNLILNGCKIKSFEVESSYRCLDVNTIEDWEIYEKKYKQLNKTTHR